MRSLRFAVIALVATASVAGVAVAKTSHAGWPKINGSFKKQTSDQGVTFTGTAKSDELLGGNGSDTLNGGPAADVLWGDWRPSGQSTTQVDHENGGPGNDYIYASHGTNYIDAGPGDDYVKAHFGRGTIDCGPGHDELYISHKAQKGYKIKNCEVISHKSLGF